MVSLGSVRPSPAPQPTDLEGLVPQSKAIEAIERTLHGKESVCPEGVMTYAQASGRENLKLIVTGSARSPAEEVIHRAPGIGQVVSDD